MKLAKVVAWYKCFINHSDICWYQYFCDIARFFFPISRKGHFGLLSTNINNFGVKHANFILFLRKLLKNVSQDNKVDDDLVIGYSFITSLILFPQEFFCNNIKS